MLHEIDTAVSKGRGLRRFGWQTVILLSAFLLVSMGGAIVASPVTLPLIWLLPLGAFVLAASSTTQSLQRRKNVN